MSDTKGKPRQPLSVQLGLFGAIAFGVTGHTLIGPLVLSIPPGETLSIRGMLCDGLSAAIGYLLGFLVGRLIEGRRA